MGGWTNRHVKSLTHVTTLPPTLVARNAARAAVEAASVALEGCAVEKLSKEGRAGGSLANDGVDKGRSNRLGCAHV